MIAVVSAGFLLLTYTAFASSLYREGMVNVVLPIYAKLELGLSQAQTGLIISIVYFGGLLSALPTGYAVDRWGVRPTLIFGAFLTTLALLLLALDTTGECHWRWPSRLGWHGDSPDRFPSLRYRSIPQGK